MTGPDPKNGRTVRMLNKGGEYRGRHNVMPGQVVGDELHVGAGEEFYTDEPTAVRLDEQHGKFDRFERVVVKDKPEAKVDPKKDPEKQPDPNAAKTNEGAGGQGNEKKDEKVSDKK